MVMSVTVWFGSKNKSFKKGMDFILLRIPIISNLVKKINSAFLTRTLSSLIASGVPIVRALEIVSGTLGNIYFKETLVKAAESVRKGGKLSEAISLYPEIYPPLVIQMIAVGEETGETSKILGKLAGFFEQEVTNETKSLAAVIEPVLMVMVGGAVGFFAISMVQPIYGMMGSFGQ